MKSSSSRSSIGKGANRDRPTIKELGKDNIHNENSDRMHSILEQTFSGV